jgi:hypothetical protein
VDSKAVAVDKTTVKLEGVDRDIIGLKQSIISIDVDINDVERSNDRSLELQKKLLRQRDGELQRGHENGQHMKELDQRLQSDDYQTE